MGLYDGRDGRSEHGSTAQMAKWLGAPVVLVLDCWSLARSAAALVSGFVGFDSGVTVAAVVFNKTGGEAHTRWLRDALDAGGVQPATLGGIPRDAGVAAACARPAESGAASGGAWGCGCPTAGGTSPEHLQALAALVEAHLDLDALLALAQPLAPPRNALTPPTPGPTPALPCSPSTAPPPSTASVPPSEGTPQGNGAVRARIAALSTSSGAPPAVAASPQRTTSLSPPASPLPSSSPGASRASTPTHTAAAGGGGGAGGGGSAASRVRIGVARDAAFPYYYTSNLQALSDCGAELVFFSPCEDALPPALSGVYLGGGSPDAFAPQLAANVGLRAALRAFAAAGGVVYAECGGAMYLCDSVTPREGLAWPMVGILPCTATLAARAMRVGYASVTVVAGSSAGAAGAGWADGERALAPPFPRDAFARGQLYQPCELVRLEGGADEGWGPAYALSLQQPGDKLGAATLEGWARGGVLASFVQLHFGSNPAFPAALLLRCRAVPPAAAAAAAAAALAAQPLDMGAFTAPALAPLVPPGTPARDRGAGLLSQMAGMSPLMLRRVPSQSTGLGLTPRGAPDAFSATMQRNSSQVSLAFGGGLHGEPSTGSFRHSRSLSRLELVGGWGGDEAAAGGQYQWALGAGETSSNMATLAAAAAAAAAASAQHSAPSSRMPFRDLTAPFFAIADGELLLPPATSDGGCRLLGDRSATVVSLLPAATEVLLALGSGVAERVLGVSDLCDVPTAGSVGAARPRVVSRSRVDVQQLSSSEVEASLRSLAERREPAFALDTAWLAATAPAVVVTQDLCGAGGGNPEASVVGRALHDARLLGPGAPTAVLVVRPRTLADALEAVLHLGAAVGAQEAAEALVDSLQARLRAVAALVAHAPCRPRVLSLEGIKPLLAGGHWLAEMKALAGGYDELQEAGAPAERLRWEQVLSYAPDILLVLPCNPSLEHTLAEVSHLASQPGFWALQAVRANNLFILQHDRFSRPGPRLVDGVEALARVMHPTLVQQQLPQGVAMRLNVPPGQRCRPHQLRNFFVPYL